MRTAGKSPGHELQKAPKEDKNGNGGSPAGRGAGSAGGGRGGGGAGNVSQRRHTVSITQNGKFPPPPPPGASHTG